MIRQLFFSVVLLTAAACDGPPQRNCKDFKTGAFSYTTVIAGETKQTTFYRTLNTEVEVFEGKQDTASVRWINDCEYILKSKHPKNKAEEKAIHIKILTTSDTSYVFEYGLVGSKQKFRGTSYKIH